VTPRRSDGPEERVDDAQRSSVLAAVSVLCADGSRAAGTEGASVSLSDAVRVLSPIWATDGTARMLEERQLTLGEGPCLDAVASGRPVLVEDLRTPPGGPDEWPAFVADVADVGVRGLFAFPLQIGVIVLGTVELYRRKAGPLSGAQLGSALETADVLGTVLLGLGSPPAAEDLLPPYRLVVHQAAGMLTVRLDVSIEEAMIRLRARAFGQGRSIHDVAADVVSGTMHLEEEES